MHPEFVLAGQHVKYDHYFEVKAQLTYLLERQRSFREVRLEGLEYDPEEQRLTATLRGPEEDVFIFKRTLLVGDAPYQLQLSRVD